MINVLMHDIARDKDRVPATRNGKEGGPWYLHFDPQCFGVVATFPLVFAIATGASVLTILVLVHITHTSSIVAFGSFLVANGTALLVGSRVGPVCEEWYHRKVYTEGLSRKGAGPGYTPIKHDNRFGFGSTTPHPFEKEDDSDRYIAAQMTEARTAQFYAALVIVVVVANVLGMMVGNYCAQHF